METLAGVKLPTGIGKQETFPTTNRPSEKKGGCKSSRVRVSARGLQSQYSGVAGGSRAEKLNYTEAEVGDGKAQVTCT